MSFLTLVVGRCRSGFMYYLGVADVLVSEGSGEQFCKRSRT